ncbi:MULTISPECIES: ABC transporter ATP-binding protein [unclassified Microbacterium]|uniref:ABC transporter ATP-binding protein n=1 Tax=unclassified Microbacterium TaxID=2609290 RepID=UPI00214BF0D4|nr:MULTISPECIES: ABC transporter ATP-binding protein [unclassified Microbacterium]MCR2811158.1 ABC transporter ATP-binding protein [Microbacterium sp. zg.B185]WIM20729.1 ABC transporter ATP-binding protein [Microbacterium sp. zg-B185]
MPDQPVRRESGSEMLRVEHLQKTYRSAQGETEAIRDLTFEVRAGEMVCIVGPSGAGKTTLMRCISGLLPASAGQVTLEGRRVSGPPEGIAVVFQEYARSLFPWLTVRENVELPLKEMKLKKPERHRRVQESLDAVSLADVPDAYPWQLSGGMQQRVAIARAVACEPHILLMDEPFAAVDAQTRADLEDLVRQLWHRLGITLLFVTHDIDESIYLGQRVLVLSARPTVILEDVQIDLPDERDQIVTRSAPEFARLRAHIYDLVRKAKKGYRPESAVTAQADTVKELP